VPPDLVFILDLDPERGLGRIRDRGTRDELFEREDYLRKVRAIFKSFRGGRFVAVDASEPAEAVHKKIFVKIMESNLFLSAKASRKRQPRKAL
jgi:thymidylate kinase